VYHPIRERGHHQVVVGTVGVNHPPRHQNLPSGAYRFEQGGQEAFALTHSPPPIDAQYVHIPPPPPIIPSQNPFLTPPSPTLNPINSPPSTPSAQSPVTPTAGMFSRTSLHLGHIAFYYLVEQINRWERFIFRFDKQFASVTALKSVIGKLSTAQFPKWLRRDFIYRFPQVTPPHLKGFEISCAEYIPAADCPAVCIVHHVSMPPEIKAILDSIVGPTPLKSPGQSSSQSLPLLSTTVGRSAGLQMSGSPSVARRVGASATTFVKPDGKS